MKIWQLCFDVNNYANLQAIPPLTAEEIQSFNGSKKLADWSPRRVEPIETDLELGDAPGFTIPVKTSLQFPIIQGGRLKM